MKSMITAVCASVALVGVTAWSQCRTTGTCGAAPAPEVKAVVPGEINPAGVAALIKAKTPMVILDARSGKYDDGKRVPGALSLNAESSAAAVAEVVADTSALIVTYCANPKCPASSKLAQHLVSLGYTNILEMPAGIQGWIEEGRAVDTAK